VRAAPSSQKSEEKIRNGLEKIEAVFVYAVRGRPPSKPPPNLMEVKGGEAQGHHREVRSEGSVDPRYGPMYKNWIGGLPRYACLRQAGADRLE
jgi:hypothetical protein